MRRPRGVGDEAREVSSGRSSVRPPARPLTLLPQHHGGAERLARARPASSAGGPGDSGGGGGPGGRDISTGPRSGGVRSSGPGSSSGSSLGPGSSGDRLAHLQRRVRASGGYRSVRRVLRGRSRPGAETGREWVRDAVFPAFLQARRQSGRLRGLPALTVILLYYYYFFKFIPSFPERGCCRRRWRGGCDSHCRRAACCKLLSPGSPGWRSWDPVTPHPPPSPALPARGPQPVAGDHADGLPGRGWGCGGAALGFLAPAPRRVQRVLRDPVGAAAPVPPAVTSRWGTGPRSSGGGPGSCPGQGGCWPSSDSRRMPALRPGSVRAAPGVPASLRASAPPAASPGADQRAGALAFCPAPGGFTG